MQESGAAKLKTREPRRPIWVALGGPGGLVRPVRASFPKQPRARRTVIRIATSIFRHLQRAAPDTMSSLSPREAPLNPQQMLIPTRYTLPVASRLRFFCLYFVSFVTAHHPRSRVPAFLFLLTLFSFFFHGLVYRPSLPALGGVITTCKDDVLLICESFGLGSGYGNGAAMGPRSQEQGRGSYTVVGGREHAFVRGNGARLRCRRRINHVIWQWTGGSGTDSVAYPDF